MLEKKYRLKKRKEFAYIFKNSKSCASKILIVNYLPTKLKNSKIGFSVSKKIGKAVVRNKVKRRMREALRGMQHQLDPQYNYIFVARKGIEEATYQQIVEAFQYCLEKCGRIKKELL